MRRLIAGAALVFSLPARAQALGWEPGERTTATVEGEVGERGTSPSGDGVYGRFEGDLDLGLGAGVEADAERTRGALRASVHYFSMMGVAVSYSDALGGDAGPRRVLSLAAELRPLFIPRWNRDLEHGPALLDLAIDSISLGLGAFWAEPRVGDLGDARGLELSGGFGLPLFGTSRGPWLEARGLLRWPDPARAPGERADGALLAVLSWHELVLTPLASAQ